MANDREAERPCRPRWADAAAVGALIAAVLTVFWRAALGLGVFIQGDTGVQFEPWNHVLHQALSAGRLPLWTPLMYCGYPFAAEGQTEVFYPPSLIISWLLPSVPAIAWLLICHLMIAAIGMYALARTLGHGPFAAWLCAFVFGLSAFMFGHLHSVSHACTLAWLPLLILGIELAVRGRLLPGAGLAAGAWALSALAAHPPFLFYASFAAVFWLAWRAIAWRRLVSGAAGRALASFAIIFTLGPLLAAVQLLPTIELARGSLRALAAGQLEFIAANSLLPKHLLGLVAPNWQGSPLLGQQEYLCYLGLAPLALAAIGAADRRGRLPLALALCALVLALARGNPIYSVLRFVPGFSLFRAPARFLYLFTFGAALLVPLGWERLAGWALFAVGRRRTVLAVGVVVLSVADLVVFDWSVLPLASPSVYQDPGPLAQALLADRDWYRVTVRAPVVSDPRWVPREGDRLNPDGYVVQRQSLVADVTASLGISKVEGYVSFIAPRTSAFLGAAFDLATRERNPALLSLLGVRYSVDTEDDFGFGRVLDATYGPLRIYKNDEAFPRAFVVGTTLPARDLREAVTGAVLLARMNRLRDIAVVEGSDNPGALPAASGAPRARIKVDEPRPERIRAYVELDRDGLLVLNERADAGWVARLDGRPAPALIADAFLLATPVPAGRHRVEFLYRPKGYLVGRAVSGLAILLFAGLMVSLLRGRRAGAVVASPRCGGG